MYFGFNLYIDEKTQKDQQNFDKKIQRINKVLAEKKGGTYRHFGVFLLPPYKGKKIQPPNWCKTSQSLVSAQSGHNYRLVIEFFDENISSNEHAENAENVTPNKDLEIIINLGATPKIYDSLKNDVSAISYCASLDYTKVMFKNEDNNLSVEFTFDDKNPDIARAKKYLKLLFIPQSNSD